MISYCSTRHAGMYLIAISIGVTIVIAGCSSTTDSGARAAGDPSVQGQADPSGGTADPSALSAGAKRGKQLFDTLGCMGCHKVNGQGGSVGPDLSNEGDKGRSDAWLVKQIRNPRSNDPQTVMPAYDYLSDEKVADLASYLQSLSTSRAGGGGRTQMPTARNQAAQTTPRLASASETSGGGLWAQRCGRCHNLRSPSEYSDAQWAVAVHHMRIRVPLTGQEQQEILEFLQASN
jgi:mono/diheme cytochrome c family protein